MSVRQTNNGDSGVAQPSVKSARSTIALVAALLSCCGGGGTSGGQAGSAGSGTAGQSGGGSAGNGSGGAPTAGMGNGGAAGGGAAGAAGSGGSALGGSVAMGGAAGPGSARDGGASDGANAASPPDAGKSPTAPPIANAVLWLDAAQGVEMANGAVTRWTDQSANHNDATPTSPGTAPSLIAARDNGHPAIHFDGKTRPAWLRVADAASLQWGTGDWTILVAAAYDNPLDGTHLDALGTFFSKHASASEILFCGNWPITENTEKASLHLGLGEGNPGMESIRKDFNDGKVRIYGARRVSGTMEIRVNGVVDSQRTGATGNIDLAGVAVGIGSGAGGSGRLLLRGDVQEMIAIKGALAAPDLAALETYLAEKYKPAP